MIRLLRLFAFALLLCFGTLAFADAGGAASSPVSLLWPLLALACGSVGALVRNKTPSTGFFHTALGHIVLMLFAALLGSLGPMFQAGTVNKATLMAAMIGAGSAFFAALKTSSTDAAAGGGLSMLVPLALGLAISTSGCTQTFKTCQLNALPQTAQTLAADVIGVLTNPASVVGDLEALPNQPEVQCIVQAWDAYEASKSPAVSSSKMAVALANDAKAHGHALAQAYLAKHPSTACAPRVSL